MSDRPTEARLQRAALAAHRQGIAWNDFWGEHGEQVSQVDPSRRERLRDSLLHIWATGTPSGQIPPASQLDLFDMSEAYQ